jgi:dihydrofolate reductase
MVAALDRHGAIGRGNALPWRLPDDLKRFKALTLGGPILMGRNTAQSLGRALPGRHNLVLSRSGAAPFEGMHVVDSIGAALAAAAGADELMVIGGGQVYAQLLARAERLLLTHVDTEVEDADVFFPRFDPAHWVVEWREAHAADARHPFAFEFVDYRRG